MPSLSFLRSRRLCQCFGSNQRRARTASAFASGCRRSWLMLTHGIVPCGSRAAASASVCACSVGRSALCGPICARPPPSPASTRGGRHWGSARQRGQSQPANTSCRIGHDGRPCFQWPASRGGCVCRHGSSGRAAFPLGGGGQMLAAARRLCERPRTTTLNQQQRQRHRRMKLHCAVRAEKANSKSISLFDSALFARLFAAATLNAFTHVGSAESSKFYTQIITAIVIAGCI